MHIPQKMTVQRGTLATNIATEKMLGSVRTHFAKQVMLTLFIQGSASVYLFITELKP